MEISTAVIAVNDKDVVLLQYSSGTIWHGTSCCQFVIYHLLPCGARVLPGLQNAGIAAIAEILGYAGNVEPEPDEEYCISKAQPAYFSNVCTASNWSGV